MWKRPSIMESAEIRCCGVIEADIDDAYRQSDAPNATRSPRSNGHYSFQPYAYPRSALSDWERVMCKATIEDYQRHFNLKIGVYVQGKQIKYARVALDTWLYNFLCAPNQRI